MVIIYTVIAALHLIVTYWFSISGTHDSTANFIYNLTASLPLVLALLVQLTKHVRTYPLLRPIIFSFLIGGLGIILGQSTWFYFNTFASTEIPYPSIADFFYLAFYPANMIALFFINNRLNIKWKLADTVICLIFAIIFSVITSSFVNQSVSSSDPIFITILNFSYPIMDALLLAISVTIMRSHIGSGYQYFFLLMFGYLITAIADTAFSYQTLNETYWNGNTTDFLYVLAYTLLALGIHFLPTMMKHTPQKSMLNSSTSVSLN